MKRYLFNLATALSSVLCVATMALWLRSYQRQGWVKWTGCGSSRCYALVVGSYPGRLSVGIDWQAANATPLKQGDFIGPPMSAETGYRSWSGDPPRSTDTYDTYDMTLPQRPDLYQFAGLAWYAHHSYTDGWNLLVPHRYVALFAAVLPLRWIWLRHRAMRRKRRNMCTVCGYDLRATPGRCPECGTSGAAGAAAEPTNAPNRGGG
ncbi:MAG TPA: hypothetical protein VK968_04700 [Roseimicrobium sp.]|nr:hypothetical protein [Roseimicrobium sp.]